MVKKIISFVTQSVYPLFIFYWWIFRPRRRGVRVIVVSRDQVLMIRPTYLKNALWTFPGGGVKKGETLEQAAMREVKEETGITIQDVVFLESLISDKEFKIDEISIVCATALGTDNPHIQDILEIAEAKWHSLNALPKMGPIAQGIFAMYKKHTQ